MHKKDDFQKHPTNPGNKRKWHRVEDFSIMVVKKINLTVRPKLDFSLTRFFPMEQRVPTHHKNLAWIPNHDFPSFASRRGTKISVRKPSGSLLRGLSQAQQKKEGRKIGKFEAFGLLEYESPNCRGMFWCFDFGVLILILNLSLKLSWTFISPPGFFFQASNLWVRPPNQRWLRFSCQGRRTLRPRWWVLGVPRVRVARWTFFSRPGKPLGFCQPQKG